MKISFMRKAWFLWLLLLVTALSPLAGQEENPDSPPQEQPSINWDTYVPDLYRAGDMTFGISAGVMIPTLYTGKGMDGNSSNIGPGGVLMLSYTYFLSPHWFMGGEVEPMFAGTGGGNMIYIVPFGMHVGYQFVIGRFEFPIRLMTGFAPQKYLEKGYFGWIIKPGISGFFRYDADWSFGLNVQWWMLPQWPKNGKDVFGNFLEISFSARYHF
ncbi:MAG: hypothetical protein FWD78_16150 [Treponema sp.]|nr:hypothetical protein [Treponema sp.]